MLCIGDKLKLPAGFPFANIGDKDYFPLKRTRTVTVEEDQMGKIIVCTTGDIRGTDLLTWGIVRRGKKGELFLVEKGV